MTLHATTQPRAKDARAQTVEKGSDDSTVALHTPRRRALQAGLAPHLLTDRRAAPEETVSSHYHGLGPGARRDRLLGRADRPKHGALLGAVLAPAAQVADFAAELYGDYLRRSLHYLCRSPTSPLDARSCSVRLSRWGPGEFLVNLRFLF